MSSVGGLDDGAIGVGMKLVSGWSVQASKLAWMKFSFEIALSIELH
jgi:hypothetical protein